MLDRGQGRDFEDHWRYLKCFALAGSLRCCSATSDDSERVVEGCRLVSMLICLWVCQMLE